ncbi:MAG: hypothetical protein WDN04_18975 [Rhodospirillales bacterium]
MNISKRINAHNRNSAAATCCWWRWKSKHGDIFQPKFFDALRRITDEVVFLPGVDRTACFQPLHAGHAVCRGVEGGFNGGPVIPNTFKPDATGFGLVKTNIVKAGILGRLVANNYRSAVVSAHLNDFDPHTGAKLDYAAFADLLDKEYPRQIQQRGYRSARAGFAQAVGDITHGAQVIVMFFGISLAVAAFLLYLVSRSAYLTAATLTCSVIARCLAARHHHHPRLRHRPDFGADPVPDPGDRREPRGADRAVQCAAGRRGGIARKNPPA